MKENKIKKFGQTMMNKLRSFDRTALVSICTGGIFALMGVFQLVLVLLTPVSQTAGHYFLIAADILIAVGCAGYAVFRQRTLRGNAAQDQRTRDAQEETGNTAEGMPREKKRPSGQKTGAERPHTGSSASGGERASSPLRESSENRDKGTERRRSYGSDGQTGYRRASDQRPQPVRRTYESSEQTERGSVSDQRPQPVRRTYESSGQTERGSVSDQRPQPVRRTYESSEQAERGRASDQLPQPESRQTRFNNRHTGSQ